MKNKIALCWTNTAIKYDFPLRDITLRGARGRAPIIFTYAAILGGSLRAGRLLTS